MKLSQRRINRTRKRSIDCVKHIVKHNVWDLEKDELEAILDALADTPLSLQNYFRNKSPPCKRRLQTMPNCVKSPERYTPTIEEYENKVQNHVKTLKMNRDRRNIKMVPGDFSIKTLDLQMNVRPSYLPGYNKQGGFKL